MEQAKTSERKWAQVDRTLLNSGPEQSSSKKAESARPLRKETVSKSKSDKLVCRYCGSEDLAPSFIKRRDRRCRKCFSKRYGSVARAPKGRPKISFTTM